PLAQLLVFWNGNQVDIVLSAQRLDQLLVIGLVAVLSQDAQLSLTLLNGPASLVQATAQAVVRQGLLQNHLHSGVDVHGLAGGGGLLHNHGRSLSVRHFGPRLLSLPSLLS
ncbi:hypothetical protein Vafri_14369, partial [Volvox africanus]